MTAVTLSPNTDILGVIDIQPDFMPGGALPVPDGDTIIAPINTLLTYYFSRAFATQDWHPRGHFSFASSHPTYKPFENLVTSERLQTLWPDHTIQDTPGAALHPALKTGPIQLIIRKGSHPDIDSYSAFADNSNHHTTGLAAWLRDRGIKRVFFCGLVLEYCVQFSALDALKEGFEAFIIKEATKGLGADKAEHGASVEQTLQNLEKKGVHIVSMHDLKRVFSL